MRDELIGTYEFDVSLVYFKDSHVLQHQWIAMFNPEGANFSDISANLKISIAVQGPGDEQIQLKDQEGPDKPGQQVLMPAQIKKEFSQLKIRFIQAQHLPNLDIMGTIDAMITTEFFGKKWKTKATTAKDNIAAIEQEFWIPIQLPLASDRLVLDLWDQDKASLEKVGSMFFSLKELLAKGAPEGGYFYWQNIYGAPVDRGGPVATMMNNNPECASAWKGRILMHIDSKDSKHPEKREQNLEEGIKQRALNEGLFQPKQYTVIAEVGQGICLAGAKKYKVMIKIADKEFLTKDPVENKKGYCRWSERFKTETFESEYSSRDQMDKVIVYLMDGNNPVCYWKGPITDFYDKDPDYKWLSMKNDLAIGKVSNDYEAGMIQVKMTILD